MCLLEQNNKWISCPLITHRFPFWPSQTHIECMRDLSLNLLHIVQFKISSSFYLSCQQRRVFPHFQAEMFTYQPSQRFCGTIMMILVFLVRSLHKKPEVSSKKMEMHCCSTHPFVFWTWGPVDVDQSRSFAQMQHLAGWTLPPCCTVFTEFYCAKDCTIAIASRRLICLCSG